MHRYRDAIVSEEHSRFERSMVGAYVLFPYKDEQQYKEHRFYKSIEKVNIGGLPFLPTATTLVSKMIDDLVDDSPDSAFERATLPRGIESKLAKVNWSRQEVLIGPLRDRSQLDVCLQNQFYHIPAARLPDDRLPIHYVAIYQSRAMFGTEAQIAYYGEVKRIQKVKRKDIQEVPIYYGSPEEDYYRIEIKQWRKLARPIQVAPGVRMPRFTNEFLVKHSDSSAELFFKSQEEYRFYSELKRYISSASIINDEEGPTGFLFGQNRIVFQSGEIRLIQQGRMITQCKVADFIRRPNAQFRDLMRKIKT